MVDTHQTEQLSSILLNQQKKWCHLLGIMDVKHIKNSWQEKKYHQIQERLYSIQQALKRIDEQEFGKCITCNQDISYQRLSRLPSASRCLDCQQKYERQPSRTSQLT